MPAEFIRGSVTYIKTDIFGLNDIVYWHNYVGELKRNQHCPAIDIKIRFPARQ